MPTTGAPAATSGTLAGTTGTTGFPAVTTSTATTTTGFVAVTTGGPSSTAGLPGGSSGLTGGTTGVTTGLSPGAMADGGVGTTGADTTGAGPAMSGGGLEPIIPEITGECPTFETGTMTIGGLSGISVQVGPKGNGDGSLLFYWHGTGSRAGEVNSLMPADVRDDILAKGGIIISPQGSTGEGRDCSGTGTFYPSDFEVADIIVACAVRDHNINPRRIYTTGCSAGGLQAGCMGVQRSSYIAAAVPNSGGSVFPAPLQDPMRVPAVMTMHGGSQDMVIVTFSETSATYDKQIKDAGGFVVNCDHGGGHCQAPADVYRAGWQFMQDHPFGVDPEPYSSSLPAGFPSSCSIY